MDTKREPQGHGHWKRDTRTRTLDRNTRTWTLGRTLGHEHSETDTDTGRGTLGHRHWERDTRTRTWTLGEGH